MYYVEAGEEMWPGGPKAPHAGYITKGDNNATNSLLDQQTGIMPNTPIKDEWVVGVVKFKIPYIGKLRLIFT
jgi:signal peptidase